MATARVRPEPPLVVIVGPTASGKTGLAVGIAKEFGGEVISADSRAIYKGLSIGTAKPTKEDQQGIPHWGIDLVMPGERFTAADFKEYAIQKITEIRMRGRVPIIAGGTGLYVDAVLYDFEFPAVANDTTRRDELMNWPLEDLTSYCIEHNIALPENSKNKRHVVNSILRKGQLLKRKYEPTENTIVVGIATEKEALRQRIEQRADVIITPCVIAEAARAAKQYGWDNEAMTGNVYPLVRQHLENDLTLEELKQKFITSDWRLAKRQLTWFHRNEHILWLPLDKAYTYLARELDKVNNL